MFAKAWGASDDRRHKIISHPERSKRTALDKNIEHIKDRLAQYVGGISATERLRDAHERCGHGALADVIEEADVSVQHDPDRRQRMVEGVDVVGVALKASPVTDVGLPPLGQEDRREHLTAVRVLSIQMREPCGALDSLGKQVT